MDDNDNDNDNDAPPIPNTITITTITNTTTTNTHPPTSTPILKREWKSNYMRDYYDCHVCIAFLFCILFLHLASCLLFRSFFYDQFQMCSKIVRIFDCEIFSTDRVYLFILGVVTYWQHVLPFVGKWLYYNQSNYYNLATIDGHATTISHVTAVYS